MIDEKLKRVLTRNRCTLLGVGPMSKNCVDASIEISNELECPIFLIASRRQIDSANLGGGYVENWSTEAFAEYVLEKDKKGMIVLSRDHGGPWQNESEKSKDLSLTKAMDSAKKSFECDISNGFQKIHIDPSVDIHGQPTVDQVLDRICELYDACWEAAQKYGSKIIFEIGTEEQSGSTNSQEELDYTLEKLNSFCFRNKFSTPTFVVIQGGTKVMETRNVGTFGLPMRVKNEIPPEIQLPKMLDICEHHGVFMKAHNTDYLSNEALSWYPKLGIHAANIAPEFGVAETRALLNLLKSLGRNDLADRFIELSFKSKKWSKWMLPKTEATDEQKAIIAGHYVFATEECRLIKDEAAVDCAGIGKNIDQVLKDAVKTSIKRYVECFRLGELR